MTTVEIKDVEIPQTMQRAMARQAEAERERRAKIIAAEGEFQASEKLAAGGRDRSASTPSRSSCATSRRCSRSPGSRTPRSIFPLPIDLFRPFLEAAQRETADRGGSAPPP